MNNLGKRIERLEQKQGGSVCPTCGHSKGERIEVEFIELKPGEKERSGPDRCPDCGALLYFIIGKGYQAEGGSNQ